MKVISLFSGAGISDVGFHQAGYECLAQVEIDKTASSVRRRHFPDCEHHQDIHEFSAIRFRGTCDVVAGGFPCQDYSVAGNRAGLAGDRGALWWEMLRVIREAEPTYVWGENVPGILSADQGRSFRTIIMSLVELGYSVAWRVLDLRYFGVPQRRRRVFIVGTRMAGPSRGRAGVSLFEPDCLPWHPSQGREEGEGSAWVAGTLSANGGGKGGGTTDGNETSFLVPWTVGTLAANTGGLTRPAGNANEPDFCIPVYAPLAGYNGWNDTPKTDAGKVLRSLRESLGEEAFSQWAIGRLRCLSASQVLRSKVHGGGIRCAAKSIGAMANNSLPCEEDGSCWPMCLLREARAGYSSQGRGPHEQLIGELGAYLSGLSQQEAPTQRFLRDLWFASKGTRVLRQALSAFQDARGPHASEGQPVQSATQSARVRRLLPIEAERLMGLPDGYTEFGADGERISNSARYRMLGNGWSVPQARWLAERFSKEAA